MSGSGGGRDDDYGGRPPAPAPTRPSDTTGVDPTEAGGGAGGGGGGAVDVVDACDVVQRAPLNSVKGAAAALRVGDDLDVHLDESEPRPVLSVHDRGGRVVGSLTHRGHVLLIQCIKRGRAYVAVVTSVNGAAVEVRVQPA